MKKLVFSFVILVFSPLGTSVYAGCFDRILGRTATVCCPSVEPQSFSRQYVEYCSSPYGVLVQPPTACLPSSASSALEYCQPSGATYSVENAVQCCETVEMSAQTVAGSSSTNESAKLEGLRWDMIKIKEKVGVTLTEEEKRIAAQNRP